MDTYVVGDIHGRTEVVDYFVDIANQCSDVQVIFLGDFMDSFNRSVDDQIRCLQKVLVANQEHGRVRSVVGNHEISYMNPNVRCSGYNGEAQGYFNLLKGAVTLCFENYIWLDDILITHAGLSQRFLDEQKLTVEQALNHEMLWNKVGRARGGFSQGVGGIRWCDFQKEFEPVPGLRQIFGHTAGAGLRKRFSYTRNNFEAYNESWCIDCLDEDNAALLVREGNIKEFYFET
jgi:hypothetical protein